MRFSVSDTAEYGDYVSGPRHHRGRQGRDAGRPQGHPGRHVRERWVDENETGGQQFRRMREQIATTRSSRSAPSCARRCRSSTRSRSRPARRRPRPRPRAAGASGSTGTSREPGRSPADGPFVPAGSVRIFDTTLRDGEQAPGAGLTAAEKLEVARQLVRLKVDVIEAGFPAASPGDFEAVRRIAQETAGHRGRGARALQGRRPAARHRGDQGRGAAAPPRVHRHERHPPQAQAPVHRETALAEAVRWVRYGREQLGRDAEIEFSAEDASRTDLDYLMQVYEAVVEAGASTVNIPDTVGYAIPSEFGRLTRARRRARRARRHGQRPLPQRPRARDGEHAGGGPGGRPPGRGHDQRPRRARRQRLARRGRDGAADAPDAVPAARQPASRPSRSRPRRGSSRTSRASRSSPTRRSSAATPSRTSRASTRTACIKNPLTYEIMTPAVRRARRQPADDRQAVGSARPAGQAQGDSATRSRATRSTRSTARRSRSPTRRRTSPTPTCWRSWSSARPRCPRASPLEGWSVTSVARREGHRHGHADRRRWRAVRRIDRQRTGERAVRGDRPGAPAGARLAPDPHRVRDQGRLGRRGRAGPGAGALPALDPTRDPARWS